MYLPLTLQRERKLDLVLTVLGFIAAFIPIFGLLLAPLQVVSLAHWFWEAAVPAAGVLVLIALYGLARNHRLFSRVAVGVAAGFIASLGLDVVRLTGVAIRVMPDIPAAVGAMAAGMKMVGPPPFGVLPWAIGLPAGIVALGFFYHLILNGALWGAGYSLALGRAPVWAGIVWGVLIWLIMMVSPPFLMMGYTPFGLNHELLPAAITLLAHLVYGTVFVLLQRRWIDGKVWPEGIRALWPESSEAHSAS